MSLVPLGKKGGERRFLFCSFLFLAASLHAAELNEARVTQVVNDVKILPEQDAPRPAIVSDAVRDKTAVRTGTQSRSELTFNDQTITRLGATQSHWRTPRRSAALPVVEIAPRVNSRVSSCFSLDRKLAFLQQSLCSGLLRIVRSGEEDGRTNKIQMDED